MLLPKTLVVSALGILAIPSQNARIQEQLKSSFKCLNVFYKVGMWRN